MRKVQVAQGICLAFIVYCFAGQFVGIGLANSSKSKCGTFVLMGAARVRLRRRKRYSAWERADAESGGIYSENVRSLVQEYPTLTPMELRVAAMVKAMLPSWRIGELLCISEKSVENYRVKIRRKTGCCDRRLNSHLARV